MSTVTEDLFPKGMGKGCGDSVPAPWGHLEETKFSCPVDCSHSSAASVSWMEQGLAPLAAAPPFPPRYLDHQEPVMGRKQKTPSSPNNVVL